MNRRAMLQSVVTVGWWLADDGSRAQAGIKAAIAPDGADTSAVFQSLEQPVSVPLRELVHPWQTVEFLARCPSIGLPDGKVVSIPLDGMVIRLPLHAGESIDQQLKAYSLVCPHEWCTLRLVTDMRDIIYAEARVNRPVLACPCHFSAYDPVQDGERLAGPARRGAYRFQFHVDGDAVVITDVEIDVIRLASPQANE